jgi:hypothetical protein
MPTTKTTWSISEPIATCISFPGPELCRDLHPAGDVSGGVISSQIVFAFPTFWQQAMYVGTDNHIHELYRWGCRERRLSTTANLVEKRPDAADRAELAETGSPIATHRGTPPT